MTIEIHKFDETKVSTLPCYEEAQGQETTAYLCVDVLRKQLWVAAKLPRDNGISPRQARGYVHTFRVPNNLTARGYNDFMEGPGLQGLVELMSKEAEEHCANGNSYVHLSDTGNDAREALERLCESVECGDYEGLEPVCAYWYLTDSSYAELAAKGPEGVVAEALKDGYYLDARDVQKRLMEMKEAQDDVRA
jgi:hypothetical protein